VEREQAKKKNQKLRDVHDYANLGGYTMIYPHGDNKANAKYDDLLDASSRLWQDFTSGVSRSTMN
jgi:hypothetical protein